MKWWSEGVATCSLDDTRAAAPPTGGWTALGAEVGDDSAGVDGAHSAPTFLCIGTHVDGTKQTKERLL